MKSKKKIFYQTYQLAQKAKYHCRPNPAVGAVIVKDDRVIGEGCTQAIGQEHAEIQAIRSVKDKSLLIGAQLYVTLMPCDHYGKTPPCSEAIIKAKISEIHVANHDPSFSSEKIENKFKKQRIKIFYDFPSEISEKIFYLNLDFYKRVLVRIPFFTVKYAMTIDGKIATRNLSSKWISNAFSRKNVHQERSQHDAICVGQNTLLIDNPRLTIRLSKVKKIKQPLIILPLSRDILMSDLRIFKQKEVVFILKKQFFKSLAVIKQHQKKVIFYKDDFFSSAVLKELMKIYHINSIFVEGGGSLHSTLLAKNLIDKISVYISPKILGDGRSALSPFSLLQSSTNEQLKSNSKNNPAITDIKKARQIDAINVQNFAEDIHLSGYLNPQIKNFFKKIVPSKTGKIK